MLLDKSGRGSGFLRVEVTTQKRRKLIKRTKIAVRGLRGVGAVWFFGCEYIFPQQGKLLTVA